MASEWEEQFCAEKIEGQTYLSVLRKSDDLHFRKLSRRVYSQLKAGGHHSDR